jgi:hypothetical protein
MELRGGLTVDSSVFLLFYYGGNIALGLVLSLIKIKETPSTPQEP